MSRQLRTLLIGAVLVLVLGIATFALHVPYVILTPGPTINTLGTSSDSDIIAIDGTKISEPTGKLNLTTVSVQSSDTTVGGAILGWLQGDEVVVPHDSIYPPGQSQQETDEQDKQDFTESQDSAIEAAACQLHYPNAFSVLSVDPSSPNAKVLRSGDQFISVNGAAVTDDASLRKALTGFKAGQTVSLVVRRNGAPQNLTATLLPAAAPSTTPRIGITVTTGCTFPFPVHLSLTGIVGPSAGLMFALGIVDKLSEKDFTGGRFIAGTGTIDRNGSVGPIGGIQLEDARSQAGRRNGLSGAGKQLLRRARQHPQWAASHRGQLTQRRHPGPGGPQRRQDRSAALLTGTTRLNRAVSRAAPGPGSAPVPTR